MYVKPTHLLLIFSRINVLVVSLLLVTCIFFSALIPPLQSPDENDHIKRSYLLSKGVILLDQPQGKSSGGMIDSGLLAYMDAYPRNMHTLSSEKIDLADDIKWSGIKRYSPAPGTGYYFPIIYAPQAIGLTIGESFDLTIDSSYRLARLFSLITIATLILIAFSVYPTNPLVIALIVIPMSIFQYSSASLDGVSAALTILSIAAFMKIATDKEKANTSLFYLLAFSVILLATSRVHLLPLFALVLMSCFYLKSKKYYFIFFLSLIAVLVWLILAIKTTVDLRVVIAAPTSEIIFFYLKNPLTFFNVLLSTLYDKSLLIGYCRSFLGVLGWLDTSFTTNTYYFFLACLVLVGLLTVSVKSIKSNWVPRALLIVLSFASSLLIFFALLVTWTPHPASTILGVQGRYFYGPAIMFAYAVSGDLNLYEGVYRKVALVLVVILYAFTLFATTKLLLDRYYLAFEYSQVSSETAIPA